MLTDDEFDERFSQFESYINELGDDIQDTHEGQIPAEELDRDEPVDYKLISVNEDSYDCIYGIGGRKDKDVFFLQYPFDLIGAMEEFISSDEAQEVFGIDEFSQEDPRSTSKMILDRVSEEDMSRLKYNLHDKITNPETISIIQETESGGIRGFIILRHIFPSDDDFGIKSFYEGVIAVTSTGEKGRRYLNNSFALDIPEEVDEQSEFRLHFEPDNIFS